MKRNFRKPLIVFTPKSLLRHPLAVSTIEDFTNGEFQEIIDDTINPDNVKRLVFCSGKFYYDLFAEREKLQREDIALIRIEQLFPLHKDKIENVINRYNKVENYIWAQEEPKNMGAWSFMMQRFELVNLQVASRDYSSVPAPGSSTRDKRRQRSVIDEVFGTINN
jgi:2-oxoglutarate dehydrogenase E1 component